jgi:hypothetical protein
MGEHFVIAQPARLFRHTPDVVAQLTQTGDDRMVDVLVRDPFHAAWSPVGCTTSQRMTAAA